MENAEEQGFNKSEIFQSCTAANKLIYFGGISIKMCWWRIWKCGQIVKN